MSGFLDDVFASFDEAAASRELDRLHADAVKKQEALKVAQQALEVAQVEFERTRRSVRELEDMLLIFRRWRTRQKGSGDFDLWPEVTDEGRTAVDGGPVERPRRGREAVRRLFADHPPDTEWRIRDVVTALELDPKSDTHAIGVALSRMYRAGELERPRHGIYRRKVALDADLAALRLGQDTSTRTEEDS